MGGAKNCPETPRQKMIGMMYLVLTAMLALNVSKDILDGFTRVDNSLHSSIDATYARNEKLYSDFKHANEENPDKTREMYEKAGQLRRKSDSLYNYIQDYKVAIVSLADGESEVQKRINNDPNGDPTREIVNKDNKDVTGQYTLVETAEDGRLNGEHLKEAIANYREFLCELVREHDPQMQGQFSSLFSTDPIYNHHDRKDEEWVKATFDEVPLCASITLLTKIQNDIRASEGQMVQYLMQRTDAADLRVNKFEAHVIPDPSDYVMRGSHYRAKIILAAVDSTKTPDCYVEGVKLGSDGVYDVVASSSGPKTIKGYLTFLDNEGTVIEVPFQHDYTVGEPSASISNTELSAIYAEYDNKYSISVPGVPADKMRIQVEGGKVTSDDKRGHVVIRIAPEAIGKEVKIVVMADVDGTGKMVKMGEEAYKVKKLPNPQGFVQLPNGALFRDKIAPSTLGGGKCKVVASYGEDVLLKLDFDIVSFQTKINGKSLNSSGPNFSTDQLNSIKKQKKGAMVKFENIRFKAKGGETVKTLESFTIEMN